MNRFVLFDLDGTLLLSNAQEDRLFSQTYETVVGTPIPTVDWHSLGASTDHSILRALGMNEARIERFLHYLAQRWQIEVEVDPPPLRDGLADAMQYLRQRNVACGIATGGSRGVASIKRALLGAQAPALLATSESGADRIGLLRHAARSFTQTDGVYVGDGPWDRDAAHAVGLGFIAVGQQAGLPGVETVLDAVHAAMD